MERENKIKACIFGVISDTHGLIRPEVEKKLANCDYILHAGDVGGEEIIKRLERICPVYAVRGNMDGGPWADSLPETMMVELGNVFVYILHNVYALDLDAKAAGIHLVVSGHTHRPEKLEKDGVVYLNPGSAGPKRPGKPVSLAFVHCTDGKIKAEIEIIDNN